MKKYYLSFCFICMTMLTTEIFSQTYTIPVVVHNMHNGNLGKMTNPEIIDILEQVNIYYEQYTPRFQFKLATLAPDGNCGIAINDVQTSSPFGSRNNISLDIQLKNEIIWPTNQYLNIWTVADIDNDSYAGYATTPCSINGNVDPPSGNCIDFQNQNNPNTQIDGIVFKYDEPAYVLIHEMTHWLNVWHTNGPDGISSNNPFWVGCHGPSENLTNGDFVADTPPVDYALIGQTQNTCSLDVPDEMDDLNNLMISQIASISINSTLTNGQLSRMSDCLQYIRTNISSFSNLVLTGTDSFSAVLDNPTITQNTVWNLSNTIHTLDIMGDLTIEENVILDIDNIKLRFCEGGRLIVKSGAKLLVSRTTLTSITDAKWDGIILQGPASTYETFVSKDRSRIENARVGVKSYGRSIDARVTGFINCDIGIDARPNPYSYILINHCNYENNSNTGFTSFIKLDRWNGYCSITNSGFSSVSSSACINEHGVGINAENTYFFTKDCSFNNLGHGIKVNSGSGQKPFVVLDNNFYGCYRGISNISTGNCKIWKNTFDNSGLAVDDVFTCMGGNDPIENQVAIYLESNMTGIDIQDNNFINDSNLETVNIYADNLGAANNKIRNNVFDSPFGIIGEGLNSTAFNFDPFKKGLYFSCNDFKSSERAVWALGTTKLSVRQIQFNIGGSMINTSAANSWLNGVADDIMSDYILSTKIEYYHSTEPNDEPTEINGGVDLIDADPFACSNETSGSIFGLNPNTPFDPTNGVPTSGVPNDLPNLVTDQNNTEGDIANLVSNINGNVYSQQQLLEGTGLWETNSELISEIIALYQLYPSVWNESNYINYLMKLDGIGGDYSAVKYFVGQSSWSAASQVLNSIPNKYTLTADQNSEHNATINLYGTLNSTSIDNLTQTQINSIKSIAEGNNGNAKSWAISIMNMHGYNYTSTFSLPTNRVRNGNVKNEEGLDIVSIYPNPSTDRINLDYNKNVSITTVSIQSSTGVEVMRITDGDIRNIDISNLSKGMYLLNIQSNNQEVQTHKFIKI